MKGYINQRCHNLGTRVVTSSAATADSAAATAAAAAAAASRLQQHLEQLCAVSGNGHHRRNLCPES
jgi:predicted secreted protein